MQRYHPRGCRKALGAHLRYFVRDRQGRLLGCAQFEYATRRLACRDEWIGWQGEAFHRRLRLLVRQSRYLLLPWVQVPNLASHALAALLRQLPGDRQRERGCTPVLVETFVDPEQRSGTCYEAAGWQRLGLTEGRQERFTELWRDVIADVARVAAEYDGEWIRRRRKVNTLLVVLFVFRLVYDAPHRQGYAATLQQVWEQVVECHIVWMKKGIIYESAQMHRWRKSGFDATRDLNR